VFTIPAASGIPKRLTWPRGADAAVGLTPDGKRVLFRSRRLSTNATDQLFTVPTEGGLAEPCRCSSPNSDPSHPTASGSPIRQLRPRSICGDATEAAAPATSRWRISDSSVEKLPRENSNDYYPMWIGDSVYFLSDRNGAFTHFQYEIAKHQVREVIHNQRKDLKSASAGPGVIAYEQFGAIFLYDLKTGKSQKQEIALAGDLPEVRPHFVNVCSSIVNAGISPTGARAVFEARGDIFTVPGETGDIRNLTGTSGVHKRSPAWSPDGKSIAWFSDESGENALQVGSQDGKAPVRKFTLDVNPSFYYQPVWSPDSKKIAYSDNTSRFGFSISKKPLPSR
jgi:tricorn protease